MAKFRCLSRIGLASISAGQVLYYNNRERGRFHEEGWVKVVMKPDVGDSEDPKKTMLVEPIQIVVKGDYGSMSSGNFVAGFSQLSLIKP